VTDGGELDEHSRAPGIVECTRQLVVLVIHMSEELQKTVVCRSGRIRVRLTACCKIPSQNRSSATSRRFRKVFQSDSGNPCDIDYSQYRATHITRLNKDRGKRLISMCRLPGLAEQCG
jgi:hypothetical protein